MVLEGMAGGEEASVLKCRTYARFRWSMKT